jgi:hypothetical protein
LSEEIAKPLERYRPSFYRLFKPPLTINPRGVKTLWSLLVSVCDYYQWWRRIYSCWGPAGLHIGGGGVGWPHRVNSSALPPGNLIPVLCSWFFILQLNHVDGKY